MIDTDIPDRLVWELDSSGKVTTSNFLRSFVPSLPVIKMFDIIWKPWLPMKVSCFLWKMLQCALPTDDNVVRTGFNMVSKCVCCKEPDVETMEHSFLQIDYADLCYNTL